MSFARAVRDYERLTSGLEAAIGTADAILSATKNRQSAAAVFVEGLERDTVKCGIFRQVAMADVPPTAKDIGDAMGYTPEGHSVETEMRFLLRAGLVWRPVKKQPLGYARGFSPSRYALTDLGQAVWRALQDASRR
jgi:hypothetical protein